MSGPGFWDDQQRAQEIIGQVNSLKKITDTWSRLMGECSELSEFAEIAMMENESSMTEEIAQGLKSLRADSTIHVSTIWGR